MSVSSFCVFLRVGAQDQVKVIAQNRLESDVDREAADEQPQSLDNPLAAMEDEKVSGTFVLRFLTPFSALTFGEPVAFMQTQAHWNERPDAGVANKLWKLVTLEQFWAVYVPTNPCYWGNVPPDEIPLLNLKFWNPIYILITIGLIVFGARKKWLNTPEVLLAAGLLAIPLWFQGTRCCMMAQARYDSVIFPVYMVMGQILTRLPGRLIGMLCGISGIMLGIYSALFASWYWFF